MQTSVICLAGGFRPLAEQVEIRATARGVNFRCRSDINYNLSWHSKKTDSQRERERESE